VQQSLAARLCHYPLSNTVAEGVPLFEMATLIEKGLAGDRTALEKATSLQEFIIAVALDYPTCLAQVRNLLDNGYEIDR
jgi:hypothetical protein